MPTAEELASAYSQLQITDPTSVHYKRINVRPKLHLFRVLLYVIITLCSALTLSFGCFALTESVLASVLVGVGVVIITLVLMAKPVIIWLVMLYQNLAPDWVRNDCRFEPSCSNYMIQAVEKYGVIKGVAKGIDRLMRCTPPNGGIDNP